MLKHWAIRLVSVVVLTICMFTIAQATDCHLQARGGSETELCKGSDERALSTLLGLLSTLLALRIPAQNDEDEVVVLRRDLPVPDPPADEQ